MSHLKLFITGVFEAGVYSDLPEAEKKRIRLMNRMILIATVVILIFGVMDAVFGYYPMLILTGIVGIVAWIEQTLVKRRRYALAKHLVYFLILAIVALTAVIVGNETGAQYMLIPQAMVPLMIFRERRTSLLFFLLNLFVFALIYFLQGSIKPIVTLEKNLVALYTIVAGFSMIGIIHVFTSYARSINESFEDMILTKNEQITAAYKDITDSITYARRIQASILPSDSLIKSALPDSFILFQPKDIVAGDFYWLLQEQGKVYFAVADCTGHGVPGAMMSVMCSNALTKAVRELNDAAPGAILDRVVNILHEQLGNEVNDGMDIALCEYSPADRRLRYAGAHNSLYLLKNGVLKELKADKQPVGKYFDRKPFNTQELTVSRGEMIYLFSDGYADQFGGEAGKKFKYSRLKELLLQLHSLPVHEQKEELERTINSWRGDLQQVDDICGMGVRF